MLARRMLAWSFACRTAAEVGALIRALEKHRYIGEAELRLHWSVDAALRDREPFGAHARAFAARRRADRELDPASYDPTLWRAATADEVAAALAVFWGGDDEAREAGARLRALLEHEGLEVPDREPFTGDPESPDHPELVQMSWRLRAIDELDAERHAGALQAMSEAGEEVDVSAPVDQEGPDLGVVELTRGAPGGELAGEWVIWADGPFSYNDYVFRGASRAAKLAAPPEPASDDEG